MIGRRVAHYDITAHLGSGGMGDVYQARDVKLGRDVALKFLPEAAAGDPDRTVRFAREAKTLASLNHPNIAAIYGLEEAEGRGFLVMELVPGTTLQERLAGERLALDDALGIARQIAEALEAAHEKAIVHRDLKPANVKITPDGRVKVLDFGLARLVGGDATEAGAPLPNSPTVTGPATRAGMILGTAPYMAPEQARGRQADRRADIFAFGCVLYEMLSGRRAFEGESIPDILSRVQHDDPDWTAVSPDVPAAIHRLVRLCLQKDPMRRRQSAGDVRIDLDLALSEPMAAASAHSDRGSRVARLAWIVVTAALIVALAIPAMTYFREPRPPEMRVHFVTPPTRQPESFALSPDGRHIVFVASGSSPTDPNRLYLRPLDRNDAQALPGTEGAVLPFWSPDSRSVGFFAALALHRIDIAGGPPQELAPAVVPVGGAWSTDGTILFAPNTVSPLLRVPAAGGEALPATELREGHTGHSRPSFLPDGRQFLFRVNGGDAVSGLYLHSRDRQVPERLIAAARGIFLPPDRLLFVQQGVLFSRELDVTSGTFTGEPVTLATSVENFSTSSTGIIAHRAVSQATVRMTWFDRKGNALGDVPEGAVNTLQLSPDDSRLAGDYTTGGNRDVWIIDLARGGRSRITTHPATDGFPIWSPDGSRVVFHSDRNGTFDLWIKPSNGAGVDEPLFGTPAAEWPVHWSRDGAFLLYQKSDLRKEWDLWALPMTGSDRTPIAVGHTPFAERIGEFSPDGQWVVHDTDESGRPEIIVQSFPDPGRRRPVSTRGGVAPRGSHGGREIYFVALDGPMMAVPVTTTAATFEVGAPAALFPIQIANQLFRFQYTVSRDGRFLVSHVVAQESAPPIHLILNVNR